MKKIICILGALGLAAATSMSFAATQAPAAPQAAATTGSAVFNATQKQAIGDIIHSYLVQNPEVLIEAMQAFQVKQQQKQVSQALPKIQANAKKLFDDPASPIAGNSKGSVVLVEFYDFRCPHCKDATKSVEKLIKANPNLKVVYKDFPIFGGASLTAAKASLVAYKMDPSKYQAFHHALMTVKDQLTDESVMSLAKKAGYNVDAMKKEMDQPWVDNQVRSTVAVGAAIGVNATPMFVIGNPSAQKYAFIPGAFPVNEIQKKINSVSSS